MSLALQLLSVRHESASHDNIPFFVSSWEEHMSAGPAVGEVGDTYAEIHEDNFFELVIESS